MCHILPEQRGRENMVVIPPIPSWTSFNILLLQQHIPAQSNIGNLPVVNGNPTQLSTVNAVFLKSLAIADDLETVNALY